MYEQSISDFTIPVCSLPEGWVVQAIRHRWWARGMAAEQVWVCELFKLDSDDGSVVTGTGPSPCSAVNDAIAMVTAFAKPRRRNPGLR